MYSYTLPLSAFPLSRVGGGGEAKGIDEGYGKSCVSEVG